MTSAVTGQRSNQLSYWAKNFVPDKESSLTTTVIRTLPIYNGAPLMTTRDKESSHKWVPPYHNKWTLGDSNPGPIGYEPIALTN